MTGLRISTAAFCLLFGTLACTRRAAVPVPSKGLLPGITPAAILTPFDQRWQMIDALRAWARVAITSPQGRYSIQQALLWHRPSQVRLDTVSFFGQPVMTLVADAERMHIYYPRQGAFYQGPATAANLARFTGLPLEIDEAADLLTGYIRPAAAPAATAPYLQIDNGSYLLRFLSQQRELIQDVWIEPDRLLPTRVVRYGAHNVPAVYVRYRDFRATTATFLFPFHVTIWLPHATMEIDLRFLSVDANPALDPDVFQLSPPAGARVIPLE